jgi:hypothetical protein
VKEEGGDEPPAHELVLYMEIVPNKSLSLSVSLWQVKEEGGDEPPAHELVNGGKAGGLGASSKSGVVKREMPTWLETGDIV